MDVDEHTASLTGSEPYPYVNHQSRLLPFFVSTLLLLAPILLPWEFVLFHPVVYGVNCVCVSELSWPDSRESRSRQGKQMDWDMRTDPINSHTETHTLVYGPAVVLFFFFAVWADSMSSLAFSLSPSPGLDAFCSQPGSWEVNSGANCFDILLFVLASWC